MLRNKGFHEPVEKPRRFYKDVTVAEADDGFGILLDGRSLRTPQGRVFRAPTRAIAEQVAEEWAGQGETIELAEMHANRLANTAVESIPQSREAVADQIAQYAGTDLTCYYADDPQALVERQVAAWGPVLERAAAEEGLTFVRATGIVHRDQPPETLARVRALALELDDFGLAGLAFGAPLFGSAVLAIALQRGWLGGEAAFELSRIDETFQEEKWGVDEEAAERAARLRGEALMLERWFRGLAA
ncbi:ATP12 family protein [Phenylobacterium sp.]|uniref:ATP12 family chaperone protein n=1 Tax=Phenylobacterium sp. TaxID=1871053 RepID=UPI00281134DE|nr:ATP12 family protein [Phenylobacterium sp.]